VLQRHVSVPHHRLCVLGTTWDAGGAGSSPRRARQAALMAWNAGLASAFSHGAAPGITPHTPPRGAALRSPGFMPGLFLWGCEVACRPCKTPARWCLKRCYFNGLWQARQIADLSCRAARRNQINDSGARPRAAAGWPRCSEDPDAKGCRGEKLRLDPSLKHFCVCRTCYTIMCGGLPTPRPGARPRAAAGWPRCSGGPAREGRVGGKSARSASLVHRAHVGHPQNPGLLENSGLSNIPGCWRA
jgi:hypothetical protein